MHSGFELHWVLGLGRLFRYDYTPDKNCGVLGKGHAWPSPLALTWDFPVFICAFQTLLKNTSFSLCEKYLCSTAESCPSYYENKISARRIFDNIQRSGKSTNDCRTHHPVQVFGKQRQHVHHHFVKLKLQVFYLGAEGVCRLRKLSALTRNDAHNGTF